MNKFIIFFGLFCFMFASCAQKSKMITLEEDSGIISDGAVMAVEIEGVLFDLVVSKSPEAKMKGLSRIDQIPENGMIFLFDSPQYLIFWMKDMRFSIDIIWVNGNKIVGIAENAQNEPPNTPDSYLKKYLSGVKADKVIELNAGDAKKFNIKEGSIIKIKNGEENGK